MPVNDHLEWVEIKNFSGGLDNRDSAYLMSAESFQTMSDCFPQTGGGLRAFYKPTAMTTTNLNLSTEKPVWMAKATAANATTQNLDSYYMLLTRVTATGVIKAYVRQSTSGSWTASKTFAAPSGTDTVGGTAQVTTYSANNVAYLAVVVDHATTDEGVWLYNVSAGTWAKIQGSSPGYDQPIITYQSRLIVVVVDTVGETLRFTDPGGISFPTANYLTISDGHNDASSIAAALVSHSPSQLMVPTLYDGWYTIDGDITDPVVRYMGRDHLAQVQQQMVDTDGGVVFFEPGQGIYAAQSMGSVFTRMDEKLTPAVNTALFPGCALEGEFIFAPNGRVLHRPSGAWFTLSSYPVADNYFRDFSSNSVVGLNQASTYDLPVWTPDGSSTSRMASYTVKTAPLRSASGRNMHVREVQIPYKAFGSQSTFAVTVNGTTRTTSALAAGTGVISALFDEKDRYLDVQVVSASGNASVEAPIIEAIRIGSRPDSHQIV